ncbi:DUF4126 domain-containing protein [Zhouia amylolytica]|uniref:DUF4126 domain-containing protein n=1 Tax=Zhouia amylolytica TaxID=376730 RepID=UPI0020CEA290|nr:DUF4126 domain-containing protein [Zhouia amylolytica]MCQ0112663.1 DUF4126 domain-containing protein [Zhouia amylolytica]
MNVETIISICLGIGLAASVGFRVFLPLFVLSLVSYLGVWDLNDSWQWLSSIPAFITLGVAMLFEVFAYYIPFVDNLLDTIAIPLAAVAGTAVVVSTASDLDPLITWSLAIIAGGGTASAIKGLSSTTRLASSTSTAGLGNPVVATIETGGSIVMSLLSVFLPVVSFIIVLMILYFLYKISKKFKTSKN